jgi:hypothetical protein
MLFVALHFGKLKNKMPIIQGFEKAKWLKIECKCQTRDISPLFIGIRRILKLLTDIIPKLTLSFLAGSMS